MRTYLMDRATPFVDVVTGLDLCSFASRQVFCGSRSGGHPDGPATNRASSCPQRVD